MNDSPPHKQFGALSAWAAAASLLLVLGITAINLGYNHSRINLASLYAIPLLLAALTRGRAFLWGVFVGIVVLSLITYYFGPPPPADIAWYVRPLSRAAMLASFLGLTILLSFYISLYEQVMVSRDSAANRQTELEAANAELLAREEEIARQNEELQAQAEEMERQSEELRVANDELARRESMLESLLSLSRSLAGETTRSEAMNKICQALGELIGNEHTATAILERRGNEIHVICHHGFGPEGPVEDHWPLRESFASLVLDRGRTGFLEDIQLRPDLKIPQPREGARFRSVMAAPLRMGHGSVGSIEVYQTIPRAWTDAQINLIESLAAQASISLQASGSFEEIERERYRLRTILQTLPIGVSICDRECAQITYNPAGATMLGVPAETPVPMTSIIGRWKTYHAGALSDWALARAARGEEIALEDRELIFASGRRITILISATPFRDKEGQIIGAVSAFVDITELKRLQTELDARRREAEENSVRKTRFLAAVSHDIRTPANAISLLAELLQRTSSSPTLSDEIPEIARDLKSSAISLVNLVSDVLDLTRFDSGRVDLSETEFPLAELVADECRQFVQLARDKNIAFNCEPPPGNIVVSADRVKLARVLANLIGNAVKFTRQGSVTVDGSRLPDGRVQIRVIDTGPGIPAEHRDRIFDEYFQLKNAQRDHEKGSGLGLAICRRLTEAMDAQITLESAEGQGTTFMLTLPAQCVVRF